MHLFSLDGKLYQLILRFWDVLKLNFIWLVFSLPIVTIGASTVAAYTVTHKMVEDKEAKVIEAFVKSFRENWKQGIPLGLIHLIVFYSFYLNIEFLSQFDEVPVVFFIAVIVIEFLGMLFLTYSLPLCARYHNSILGTLKNSVTIAMKYFGTTFLLWIALGFLAFFFTYNSVLMFFGILVGPACMFLVVSGFSMKVFKAIEKANGGIAS